MSVYIEAVYHGMRFTTAQRMHDEAVSTIDGQKANGMVLDCASTGELAIIRQASWLLSVMPANAVPA